jgi:hypothetical protein
MIDRFPGSVKCDTHFDFRLIPYSAALEFGDRQRSIARCADAMATMIDLAATPSIAVEVLSKREL